jgi:hypothetical protein
LWKLTLDQKGIQPLPFDTEPAANVREHKFRDIPRWDDGVEVDWKRAGKGEGLRGLDYDTMPSANVRDHHFRETSLGPETKPFLRTSKSETLMTPLPLGEYCSVCRARMHTHTRARAHTHTSSLNTTPPTHLIFPDPTPTESVKAHMFRTERCVHQTILQTAVTAIAAILAIASAIAATPLRVVLW